MSHLSPYQPMLTARTGHRILEFLSPTTQCQPADTEVGMVTWSRGEQLVGRQRERNVLERLLDTAREGRGGVLVMHGDPGVGKTALLEHAAEAGKDFRVARAVG